MLQCNRYPGLDANEIIRLTSAIGQQGTLQLKKFEVLERLVTNSKPATRIVSPFLSSKSKRHLGSIFNARTVARNNLRRKHPQPLRWTAGILLQRQARWVL